MSETHFRIRFQHIGAHFHIRMFSARAGQTTFAKNGDLVFREDEWNSFRTLIQGSGDIIDDTSEPK